MTAARDSYAQRAQIRKFVGMARAILDTKAELSSGPTSGSGSSAGTQVVRSGGSGQATTTHPMTPEHGSAIEPCGGDLAALEQAERIAGGRPGGVAELAHEKEGGPRSTMDRACPPSRAVLTRPTRPAARSRGLLTHSDVARKPPSPRIGRSRSCRWRGQGLRDTDERDESPASAVNASRGRTDAAVVRRRRSRLAAKDSVGRYGPAQSTKSVRNGRVVW